MRHILLAFALISVLLIGCSTVKTEYQAAPSNTLGTARTFAWFDTTQSASQNQVKNPEVAAYLTKAIEKQLTSMGYRKVQKSEADFLIAWFGKVQDQVSNQSIAHFYNTYGYGTLAAKHPAMVEEGGLQRHFTTGTLVVDIIDPQVKSVVWRGSATDTIVEDMSRADVGAYLDRSVRQLFKDFPK